ncbi:MAG: hypothetical protein GVY04_18845 [Cyanobacteria bacterium]|nr:hypothetical protein [Cyanobacteria bacterium GSL.Bin1]
MLKTSLQHLLSAAAMNLERIYAWLEEIPLAKTRVSHFQNITNQKLAIVPEAMASPVHVANIAL